MPTNFPTSLDTLGAGGTLGGPFIDAAAPVDLFEDIAADFRSNTNDALLSVQARVGLTNSTDPGALSWATLSVGGVNNLGLRFAQEQTEWPGVVAESGVFLKDVTFEPMFHRAGEPKATFYSMLGGVGGGTLQDAYDASGSPASLVMSGTKNLLFNTHSGGASFVVADELGTSFFISADEVAGNLSLGTGTILKILLDGQIASNLTFDGTAHRTIGNSDSLTVQTLGASDLSFLSGNDTFITTVGVFNVSVGSNSTYSGGILNFSGTGKVAVTSSGASIDLDTTTGADINLLSGDKILLRSGGVGGEVMGLVTGSDNPTSVAKWAYRGSLYLRDNGIGGELYVKQDDASSTNWTLVGGGTLQDAYDAGNTITTSGGLPLAIDGPESFFWQSSTSNSFVLGSAVVDTTTTSGLVQTICRVGADGVVGVKSSTLNLPGGDGREFGTYLAEATNASDMDDSDIIYTYGADLTMNGDGGPTDFALGIAFYARNSTFAGAGNYASIGMWVDSSFDFCLISKTGAAVIEYGTDNEKFSFSTFDITAGIHTSDGNYTHVAKLGDQTALYSEIATYLASTGDGGDQLGGTAVKYFTTTDSNSNPLLAAGVLTTVKFDLRMNSTDAATARNDSINIEYQIPNSPGGTADQGSSAHCVYVDLPESYDSAGSGYRNNDGYYSFSRWAFYVEEGESHFRRTEFEGPVGLNKALVRFNQADNNASFHELQGYYNTDPVTPNCNLTNKDTGGVVVGPKANDFTWIGMYQVYVIDTNSIIPPGHYWVPLYEAI